ncbi:hypothetical protein E2J61_28740 (plasmid) [Klebsiella pneumoniae]|nr:hypothetical protein E2J61_28740 [Klebsiella pneumoniae]QCO63247.1 hypothetical protein E2J62_26450 [Klebsiella pneumoniae]
MRQQQDEPGRFSICSRQAAVVRELRLIRAGGRVAEFIARQPATPGFRRHFTTQTALLNKSNFC